MKDCINGTEAPDEEVVFYDGVLYIISREPDPSCNYYLHVERLDPEFSDAVTLKDIAIKYPNVELIIYDSWRDGSMYRYSNHKKGEWERVGETIGFV